MLQQSWTIDVKAEEKVCELKCDIAGIHRICGQDLLVYNLLETPILDGS
jgi:hypothetical protein